MTVMRVAGRNGPSVGTADVIVSFEHADTYTDLPAGTFRARDLRPMPPPPPAKWTDSLKEGDIVQVLHAGGWWPSVVRQRCSGGTHFDVETTAQEYAEEGIRRVRSTHVRPDWRVADGTWSFESAGATLHAQPAVLEPGGKARMVGLAERRELEGCEVDVIGRGGRRVDCA